MTDSPRATASLCDQDSSLEATFVPGAGMICSSLRHRGDELLAQNSGVAAYAARGATMGIPLLYPWANRLAGFGYRADGRTVRVPHDPARVALDDNGLPIHGVIGGLLAWELTRSSGPDALSLGARLSWSASEPELFEAFPFRHDLLYEARLGDGRLELRLTVHACGADPVPVAFGFHPYLSPAETPREGWLVELPPMRPLALDASQVPIGPKEPLGAQRFELARREFDDGFDSVSEPARFTVTGAGRRIDVELLEGFPCAQVFAPKDRQFICFEPMTAPANALRSGMGLHVLAPGERYRAGFSVQVADSVADPPS